MDSENGWFTTNRIEGKTQFSDFIQHLDLRTLVYKTFKSWKHNLKIYWQS